MATRPHVFDAINQRISDFVHAPDTAALKPGTGYYSTPFRGALFGLTDGAAVAQQLQRRRVEVLWLGTNPCMPRSLDFIVSTTPGDGDWPTFVAQQESGRYASQRFDADGDAADDFNPLHEPPRQWVYYRDALTQAGVDISAVAMANFLPWGSANTHTLLQTLHTARPTLLDAMVAFGNSLNTDIVRALRPRVLMVPLSLGRDLDRAHPVNVGMRHATNMRSHRLPDGSERGMEMFAGTCRVGGETMAVAFVRHPAGLRVRKESQRAFTQALARVLRA